MSLALFSCLEQASVSLGAPWPGLDLNCSASAVNRFGGYTSAISAASRSSDQRSASCADISRPFFLYVSCTNVLMFSYATSLSAIKRILFSSWVPKDELGAAVSATACSDSTRGNLKKLEAALET